MKQQAHTKTYSLVSITVAWAIAQWYCILQCHRFSCPICCFCFTLCVCVCASDRSFSAVRWMRDRVDGEPVAKIHLSKVTFLFVPARTKSHWILSKWMNGWKTRCDLAIYWYLGNEWNEMYGMNTSGRATKESLRMHPNANGMQIFGFCLWIW